MPGVISFLGGEHPDYGHDAHVNRLPACKDPRIHGSVGAKHMDVSADEQPRFESFILEDGMKKVEVDQETRKCCILLRDGIGSF